MVSGRMCKKTMNLDEYERNVFIVGKVLGFSYMVLDQQELADFEKLAKYVLSIIKNKKQKDGD